MHVHAWHNRLVRTTIDLPDELRGKLLELAARRGEKGFSSLVAEAVARYLGDEALKTERLRDAKLWDLQDTWSTAVVDAARRWPAVAEHWVRAQTQHYREHTAG